MKQHKLKIIKLLTMMAMCLVVSCTFKFVHGVNSLPDKVYDISESYKSVAMVALKRPGGKKVVGIGTAFAINKNNLLTAGHVCTAIKRFMEEGIVTNEIWLVYLGRSDHLAQRKGIRIKNIDSVNDICQIKLKNHGLQPLKFADYDSVNLGDKVHIVGAPHGVMISTTNGRVINKMTLGLDLVMNKKLIVSAAATGGNSGSPVLNDKGEVIGILIAGHRTFDHLSVCVPLPIVKGFMRIINIGYK